MIYPSHNDIQNIEDTVLMESCVRVSNKLKWLQCAVNTDTNFSLQTPERAIQNNSC